MNLYAVADAPLSAGFHNRMRLAMILSGRAVVGKHFSESEDAHFDAAKVQS